METHRKFQRNSLFFRSHDFPALRFFVSKSSPEIFSVLETQPRKKRIVRPENFGLPQNGCRKTALKSISANGVHNRVKDNRRPCPESPFPNLTGRRRDCRDRAFKTQKAAGAIRPPGKGRHFMLSSFFCSDLPMQKTKIRTSRKKKREINSFVRSFDRTFLSQRPTVTGKNPVTISSKSEVNHLELREMFFEIFGQKSSMTFFSCCFRTEQNAAVQVLCFHTLNDVS